MNLDSLKTGWDKKQISYSKDELQSIFEIKTKREISQVNRVMYIDTALMLFVAAALIILTFLLGLESRLLVALEIAAATSVMVIHYRIKHKLLNMSGLFDKDISVAITSLSKRLNAYLMAYQLIIPLFIGLIYLKMQWDIMVVRQLQPVDCLPEFALVIPLIALSFLTIKWLSKKMYGKQLTRLKKLQLQLSRSN